MPEQQNIEHKQSWHDELKTMINGKCITVNKKFMQAVVRIFGHDDQTGRNSEFPNYCHYLEIINIYAMWYVRNSYQPLNKALTINYQLNMKQLGIKNELTDFLQHTSPKGDVKVILNNETVWLLIISI